MDVYNEHNRASTTEMKFIILNQTGLTTTLHIKVCFDRIIHVLFLALGLVS